MHIKFKLIAVFILMVIAIFHSRNVRAADIEAKLSSDDGSTEFAVQDSGANNVAEIDSDGNLLIKGTATIEGDMKGAYIQTGSTSNALLAHDIIRHTLMPPDEANQYITESWSKAETIAKMVAIRIVLKKESDTILHFKQHDDMTDGEVYNFRGTYDGAIITVWNEEWGDLPMLNGDIVTLYITYEK